MDVDTTAKKTVKRMLTEEEKEYQEKLTKKLFLDQHFLSSSESDEEDDASEKINVSLNINNQVYFIFRNLKRRHQYGKMNHLMMKMII